MGVGEGWKSSKNIAEVPSDIHDPIPKKMVAPDTYLKVVLFWTFRKLQQPFLIDSVKGTSHDFIFQISLFFHTFNVTQGYVYWCIPTTLPHEVGNRHIDGSNYPAWVSSIQHQYMYFLTLMTIDGHIYQDSIKWFSCFCFYLKYTWSIFIEQVNFL